MDNACDYIIYSEKQLKDIKIHLFIYSNKKETFDFHGTVSFDPVKMS